MVYKEKEFRYKRYKCVILFTSLGHRCGYVGIPKKHFLYNKNYCDMNICCHGGLTYGANYLQQTNSTNLYWIGFDCGHYGDGQDVESTERYFKGYPKVLSRVKELNKDSFFGNFSAKSLEFCEQECMQIVDQIIEMEREVEV